MKRLLFVALVSSVVYPPVQAYDNNNDLAGKVVGSIAVGITVGMVGIVGINYVVEKTPSHRYASAQKTYAELDTYLSSLQGSKNSDEIATVAMQLFPTSPYPLVEMFNHLNSLRSEANNALEDKLENAVWWSKEKLFIRSCNQLADKIKDRLAVLDKVAQLVRTNTAWTSQYSLHLQQCQNDETRQIATQVLLNRLNNSFRAASVRNRNNR
jgi:hypothetical protein